MSVTRTMMDMHSTVTVTTRSSVKRRFAEYGVYFARKYREHSELYDVHYGDARGYRLNTMRQCWPFVGTPAKRHFREAFEQELAAH